MALGHSPQIVTQGLVFYIDPSNTKSYAGFGNTIYNMVNSSIGGTFVGYTSNPIDNTFTRSIVFDGVDDYIQTNYIPYFTSDFTMEVWANFSRYNDYQCILSSMNNGNAISGFWFEFGSGRGFTIYTTGSQLVLEDNIVSLTNLELNKWHHIVATRSGTGTSNVKLYVNNILCGQNTSNAAIGHTSFAMMMGKYDYVGNYSYFRGNVGSVKIYNKGLSATEILQNFNATRKKYYPEERIVTDGLILNYDFSKRSSYLGTGSVVTDLSVSGNNGTLNNSPTFTASNGGGVLFNGTNQYINVTSNPSLTNQITVSVWIKPDSINGNAWILGREGAYRLFYTSNNFVWDCATVNNNWYTTGTNILSPSIAVFNSWWHVVATYDGSNNRLYINGELKTTGANISGNIASGLTLWIMYTAIAVDQIIYGKGTIGEIKIYNRALSATEILQNYNATKGRFLNALPPVRNNLILEYDALDTASYPGTGTSWFDTSGFSNHGILTNGPVLSATGTSSSIAFDGTNDFVNIYYPAQLYSGSPITLSLWAKWITTGTTTSTIQTLVDNNYQTSPGSIGFFIQDRPDLSGFLEWGAQPGTGITRCLSTFVVGDGKWHHITATNDGATSILYVDGIQSGLARTAAGIGSSQPFINLGRWRFTQSRYLNGNIADFRIYNRALSAYEVKQNFDYYRTRYGI